MYRYLYYYSNLLSNFKYEKLSKKIKHLLLKLINILIIRK